MKTKILTLPLAEALAEISRYVRIALLAKEAGILPPNLRARAIGRYRTTAADLDNLNRALSVIALRIAQTRITAGGTHHPASYATGTTAEEQVKSLKYTVAMEYIYREVMGKDSQWMNNRLCDSRYHFRPEEVETINSTLADIANTLMCIRIAPPAPAQAPAPDTVGTAIEA